MPRPFPNESPPLWGSWREFFEDAEKRSRPSAGAGVLNHADFNIETHGVPPDVLCKICPFSLTRTSAPQQIGSPLVWWDAYELVRRV